MKYMLELGPFDCRWPLKGEGETTLFCAALTLKSPYCPKHLRRAFVRESPDTKKMEASLPTQFAHVEEPVTM
jgi:hypothetical protein